MKVEHMVMVAWRVVAVRRHGHPRVDQSLNCPASCHLTAISWRPSICQAGVMVDDGIKDRVVYANGIFLDLGAANANGLRIEIHWCRKLVPRVLIQLSKGQQGAKSYD
jgi:hypothetical protein